MTLRFRYSLRIFATSLVHLRRFRILVSNLLFIILHPKNGCPPNRSPDETVGKADIFQAWCCKTHPRFYLDLETRNPKRSKLEPFVEWSMDGINGGNNFSVAVNHKKRRKCCLTMENAVAWREIANHRAARSESKCNHRVWKMFSTRKRYRSDLCPHWKRLLTQSNESLLFAA